MWLDRRLALLTLAATSVAWAACATGRSSHPDGSRERLVRPAVAYEMLKDSPQLVVLDVRPFAEYQSAAGHLERAVSAPVGELSELWEELDLRSEDTILVYGSAGGNEQVDAAWLLIQRGLPFVVGIEGGLDAWVAGGFAVVVEDAPISPLRGPPPSGDPSD